MCVHKSILHALCVYLTMYISLKFRKSNCLSLCVSMFETWNVWVCLHVCVFVFVYVCVLWLCECLNRMCVYVHHI
jgi:hypothetical protein